MGQIGVVRILTTEVRRAGRTALCRSGKVVHQRQSLAHHLLPNKRLRIQRPKLEVLVVTHNDNDVRSLIGIGGVDVTLP